MTPSSQKAIPKNKEERGFKKQYRLRPKTKLELLFEEYRRKNNLSALRASEFVGATRNIWNQVENCPPKCQTLGNLMLSVEILKRLGYDLHEQSVKDAIRESFDFLAHKHLTNALEQIEAAKKLLDL